MTGLALPFERVWRAGLCLLFFLQQTAYSARAHSHAAPFAPVFSGYESIRGIYRAGHAYWLVDPCDGIVFTYNPKARNWKTFLAGKNFLQTMGDCYRVKMEFQKQGRQISWHIPEYKELSTTHLGYQSFNEFFFDTDTKKFGTKEVKYPEIEQQSLAQNGFEVMNFWTSIPKQYKNIRRSGILLPGKKERNPFFLLPKSNSQTLARFHPWTKEELNPLVCEAIGPYQKVENKVWFGISLDMNCEGVGGVGYFDLSTKQYRLFKVEPLTGYSTRAMAISWPFMWLAPDMSCEQADLPDASLLRIDLRTINSKNQKIEKIWPFKQDTGPITLSAATPPYVWFVTETDIFRFNTMTEQWNRYKIKLRLLKRTVATRYPVKRPPLRSPAVIQKGDVVSYGSIYEDFKNEPELFYYEIQSKSSQEGYVYHVPGSTGYHWDFFSVGSQFVPTCQFDVTLLNNSDGTVVGAFQKVPVKIFSRKKLYDNLWQANVKIKSLWIEADSAIPFVVESK